MKNKIQKYSVILVLILFTVLIYGKNLGRVDIAIDQSEGKEITKEIGSNTVVQQSFIMNQNRLCGIAIQFGTFSRENTGYLQLTIYDQNKNKVVSNRISKKNLLDNAYYEWYFDPILFTKGKEYTLEIKGDDENSEEKEIKNTVVLYKGTNKSEQMKVMKINSEEEEEVINLKVYYIK